MRSRYQKLKCRTGTGLFRTRAPTCARKLQTICVEGRDDTSILFGEKASSMRLSKLLFVLAARVEVEPTAR